MQTSAHAFQHPSLIYRRTHVLALWSFICSMLSCLAHWYAKGISRTCVCLRATLVSRLLVDLCVHNSNSLAKKRLSCKHSGRKVQLEFCPSFAPVMWPMQLCLDRLFWYTHVHTEKENMAVLSHSSSLFSLEFHSKSLLWTMGPGRPLRPSQTGTGPVGTDQYKLSLSVEGTGWILTRTSEGRFECIQKDALLSHVYARGRHSKKSKKKSKGVAAWRWTEEK